MKLDLVLNIVASALLTCVMQLLCYPYLSRVFNASEYGLILTVMGVVNAAGSAFGSSLDNARQLNNGRYLSAGIVGDFRFLSIVSSVSCFVITFAACRFVIGESLAFAAGESIVACAIFLRSYYSVGFRLAIDFKKVLAMSVVGAFGYILGMLFMPYVGIWLLPFAVGEVSMVLYCLKYSGVAFESMKRTVNFKDTLRSFLDLLGTNAVAGAMLYLDRFLVLPILGAAGVSCFTTASILGKLVGLVLTPICGVLLTYYAQAEGETEWRVICRRIGVSVAMCVVCYVIIMLIGEYTLRILYPTLADEALPYVGVASLGSLVLLSGNLLMPTALTECPTWVQPVLQVFYLIAYLAFGIIGTRTGGLSGFCIGVLCANTARYFSLILALALCRKIGVSLRQGQM